MSQAPTTTPAPTVWERLAAPFPPEAIRSYTGAGGKDLSYITARDVMGRLDEVLTPAGWSFEWAVVDLIHCVVKGRLSVVAEHTQPLVREDVGYPNSDRDEEPMKSAVSDALKRCAVHFGVARHLYAEAPHQTAPARRSALQRDPASRAVTVSPARATPAPRPDQQDQDRPDPYCACGLRRVYRTGTSKAGQPYEAWFCAAKPSQCKPVWDEGPDFYDQTDPDHGELVPAAAHARDWEPDPDEGEIPFDDTPPAPHDPTLLANYNRLIRHAIIANNAAAAATKPRPFDMAEWEILPGMSEEKITEMGRRLKARLQEHDTVLV